MMLEVLVLCNFRYEVDEGRIHAATNEVLVLCNFRYEVDLEMFKTFIERCFSTL